MKKFTLLAFESQRAELLENKNHLYLHSYQTLTPSTNSDNNKEVFLKAMLLHYLKRINLAGYGLKQA